MAALTLAVTGVTWRVPVARAETMQSCRRRGCRLNINTYRCVCPRRPRSRAGARAPRIRCPRGTRLSVRTYKPRNRVRLWCTWYQCARRRGGRVIVHGPAVQVLLSGEVIRRGENRNGARHGAWQRYTRDGKPAERQVWENGKRHGMFTSWHGSGKKKEEGLWRRGLQVGVWKRWHRNGRLQALGSYTDGKRNGVWIWWHANGKKRLQEPFRSGRIEGIRKFWDTTEKLVQTMVYVRGLKHGRFWSVRRGYKEVATYRRGDLHGVERSWYKNGKLRHESSYDHNIITGLDRLWSARGVLLHRRRFLNGRLHGLSERWYDNGKLRETGKYLKGRRVGRWTQYGPDGSVLSSHTYP